jgi:hypothetical protein
VFKGYGKREMMLDWDSVEDALADAKGIAWDTCHKIYVLMDDEQMALMKEYEYDPLISADTMTQEEMLETLHKWFDDSCGLRFISAVTTHPSDPNLGFVDLIPQGAEDDCEDCGESGCAGVCADFDDEDEDEED